MSNLDFQPLTPAELIDTLGFTIKKDVENKVVSFLCELSAYTDNSQFNISFNAPSSTGKSFIPLEISNLFPPEDVIKLGNCSPTAFFHEQGEFNKEKNAIIVDLSRKIIIFLDQPHSALLERLRSLLSHDEKEMHSKITDKNQKGGNRTKTVIIKGFPSVIFCTANSKIDEQEATRFFLLSPEVNQEKIREAVLEKIKKETDNASYKTWLEELPERKALKERILAIKEAGIQEVKIGDPKTIIDQFLTNNKVLKPRHQRDIGRLLALVKSFSLLNWLWREKDGSTITANKDDMKAAFEIWDKIAVSQELNLPPYIYKLHQEVILPLWEARTPKLGEDTKEGISRQEILQKHFGVYGRMLDNNMLRQQILPMLETAGLITQEQHPTDRRKWLVYPTLPNTTQEQNNDEARSGVKETSLEELAAEIPF